MASRPTILFAVSWLLRIGLSMLFIYAGASKMLDLAAFEKTIADYGIVFPGTEMATAVLLVVAEILAAAGVLFAIRGGLAMMVGMLILFISVLSYGLWLGLDIECGCLGFGESHDLTTAIAIDLGFLLCCGLLFACQRVGNARGGFKSEEVDASADLNLP
jgi:uncharacterized membrane protein YphA (DoxX/SURF4 family)